MSHKFDEHDLDLAIDSMRMLRYFPTDPGAHAAIKELLAKMVPSHEALCWLIDTVIENCTEWPGPADLRGLLCTHYAPQDGIDRSCSLVGFRPADYEEKAYSEHLALKAGSSPEPTLTLVKARKWPA